MRKQACKQRPAHTGEVGTATQGGQKVLADPGAPAPPAGWNSGKVLKLPRRQTGSDRR